MVHYATGKKRPEYKGKIFYRRQLTGNINLIRCHVSEAYNRGFLGRLWGYFSFVFSGLAAMFLFVKKADIIVATSPPLFIGAIAIAASKIKRAPYIFEIRDLWPESAIDTGVLTNNFIIQLSYKFEKLVYCNAQMINVLTPAFREKLIAYKNVPAEKILYIPNSADFSLSEAILRDFDRDSFRAHIGWQDKFVVLYVGAHGVANHLIQMIDAAEILKNENVLLVSIGDGMQRNDLIQEAEKRQLNNIHFLPPVSKSEVFKYIIAADAGTSILKKVETFKTVFSNKTFDYMSCKKPILMLIDGVSRKLVEEAECGIYVEPENPVQFAEEILLYRNNPELVKQHGENGYLYAKQNFDREILAEKYFNSLGLVN